MWKEYQAADKCGEPEIEKGWNQELDKLLKQISNKFWVRFYFSERTGTDTIKKYATILCAEMRFSFAFLSFCLSQPITSSYILLHEMDSIFASSLDRFQTPDVLQNAFFACWEVVSQIIKKR